MNGRTETWPALNYLESKDTLETLHRFTQIVGKLRLGKSSCLNHSWHSTLYVTARGLTTSSIPDGQRNITADFDFFSNEVLISTSTGERRALPLIHQTVSEFYGNFLKALKDLNNSYTFDPHPNELPDNISFDQDHTHCTYNPEHARNYFQVLVRVNNVMNEFRSRFIGKTSPVHFFWGSFDLAVTRFSGRLAPEHPAGVPHLPDLVVKEAYSHEVSSCGFWPGNETYPYAAFYSYAYPEPHAFKKSSIDPFEAFYHEELKEFILPYEKVRQSSDPASMLLTFFESTYRAAANRSDWDKSNLEESFYLEQLKNISPTHQKHSD